MDMGGKLSFELPSSEDLSLESDEDLLTLQVRDVLIQCVCVPSTTNSLIM